MTTFGYIKDPSSIRGIDHIISIMHRIGCSAILHDHSGETTDRPMWNYLLGELNDGDTLVLYEFCNALDDMRDLPELISICNKKDIRIISIMDNLDTTGEFYPCPSHDIIRMLLSFLKNQDKPLHQQKKEYKPLKSLEKFAIQRKRNEKDCKIINMYIACHSTDSIMEQCHIKTRRSIYYTLDKYNIKTDRLKYHNPKKEKRHEETSKHTAENKATDNGCC